MLNIFGRQSEISGSTVNSARIDISETRTTQGVSDTRQCEYDTVRFSENVEYFFVDSLIFLKVLKLHARIDSYETSTTRLVAQTLKGEYETIQITSGRVTRAETWLTVYRSPYIRMPSWIVTDSQGERLSGYFGRKFLMMRATIE